MQPVTLNAADVSLWVSRLWWPTLRVGGFVLAAPVASETTIPNFIKIILSVSLAFLVSPMVKIPVALSIFSGAGHLMLLGALAESFQTLPIGLPHIDKNFLLSVALWGAHVFESGLLIALPAVIALLI